MTPYLPQTEDDLRAMLETIGASSVQALFEDVPEACRYPDMKLPKALSEMEILTELYSMASKNSTTGCFASFIGAGAYNHFTPSAVPYLAGRGEFLTAYTPYQPEVSQGTLQAIFEYQSMVAELTGMEVVNASHYDGATSMAEAAIMSYNTARGKRSKILVSPSVHPQYRQVLRTYLPGDQLQITGDEDLNAGLDDLVKMLDEDTACLIVQNPDFFGQTAGCRRTGGCGACGRSAAGGGRQPDPQPGIIETARSVRRGYRCSRGTAAGSRSQFRRPLPGRVRSHDEERAQNAGTAGGRDGGYGGQARLCADIIAARTAYPPRKSHQQYLHQPGTDRIDGGHVPGLYG